MIFLDAVVLDVKKMIEVYVGPAVQRNSNMSKENKKSSAAEILKITLGQQSTSAWELKTVR
jgi:hypothetical protein